MNNLLNYLWPVLLAIYIISPFDAHPLFMDDLIAMGALFYFLYKNSKRKKQYYQDYNQTSGHNRRETPYNSTGTLSVEEACKILGISPSSSLDEANKAYRDKMKKSHPDKVSHLSEELQEKAKELTVSLNEALAVIKRHKGQ